MKLKFLIVEEIDKNIKATIHSSGKMGFTQGANKKMNLNEEKKILFAKNEEESNDLDLYVIITRDDKEGALKINKAGKYYYVNTQALFDELGIDYKNKKIMFDIIEIDYEGEKIFKFLKREKAKKIKQ
jgi:hypothetical protein